MASQVRINTEDAATEAVPEAVSAAARLTSAGHSGEAMAVAGHEEEQAAYRDREVIGNSLTGFFRFSNVIDWKRPFRTMTLFAVTNAVFWFVALSSYRVYCFLALCSALKVTALLVKQVAGSRRGTFPKGAHLWRSMTASWEVIDEDQDRRSGAGPLVTDSWTSFKLFLMETSSFKQQNPGKFCLLVCSLCTFFAVLGRYIPGVLILYVLVLGIFLWPLMSTQEFGFWMKPVLQKLDFGVERFLQKIRDNHEKRLLQAQAERESIEADLSSLFPKLDSTVCKEMSVSDTEASDVTWTDNGTFNLSEGHTPQTENSEDLDREEAFTGGLPEFPSVDNGTNGEDDDDLSIGLPTPSSQSQPRHSQAEGESPAPPHGDPATQAMELVHKMAGEVITAAVTAAIQERFEAAFSAAAPTRQRSSPRPNPTTLLPLDLAGESSSESDVEDFELLDQSELEQLEGELGLGAGTVSAVKPEGNASQSGDGSFLSKLLGRH
ncbi:reticulophagy regulator 1 isoform X1 [Esox lucius]|uniref:RETREG1-3/ARL6IP-like N-terminal reticulon-homology domain-containing protein n=1 Tax=Esox lucius TaxID=8010 RepID=A0AAY5K8H2_ESOLU|nr:reticulophagy regulator 1 isoform X1 [Esox lucius]